MESEIYNCDCVEYMRTLPDKCIDLILTDPPYEYDPHGSGCGAFGRRATKVYRKISDIMSGFDYDKVFAELLRVCKIPNLLIFCSNMQISRIMSYFEQKGLSVTLLVWQKTNPIPTCNGKYCSECEFVVYVRGKGAYFNNDVPFAWKKKIYTSPCRPDGNLHPAQKPIDLLTRYIKVHSKQGDTILDPFMGSGSTAIACLREQRNFIGCEINTDYFRLATKRLKQEQLTLQFEE